MVPKYPYEVERSFMIGPGKMGRDVKAFELLPAAAQYAETAKRMPATRRVMVRVTLEQWNHAEAEHGVINGSAHYENRSHRPHP